MESIVNKVWKYKQHSFSKMVSSSGLYRFSNLVFEENTKLKKSVSSGTGKKITSKIMSENNDIFRKDRVLDTDVSLIG